MRVLVTGGAGFIGTHLGARLRLSGHDVCSVDLRPTCIVGDVVGDIRDPATLERAFEHGPDQVVHLAALAGVRPSIEAPHDHVSVNVRGTLEVLEACRRHGIRRVVVASSSSVYGEAETTASHEDDPLRPMSPYAATKVAAEALARSYAARDEFEVVIVRPFTVYGPGQRSDMAIHRLLGLVRDGGHARLWRWVRDFTYVDDVVAGLVAALTVPLPDPVRIYNLGSGRPIAAETLHSAIEAVTQCVLPTNWGPARKGEPKRTHADTQRAREELGVQPDTDLLFGLAAQARALDLMPSTDLIGAWS